MKSRLLLINIFSILLPLMQNQLFAKESGPVIVVSNPLMEEIEEESIGKVPLEFEDGDSYCKFSGKFSVEAFYGQGNTLLSKESLDKIMIPLKYTIDLNSVYGYGRETYGYDIVTLQLTARSKAVGGDPDSIASTSESNIKIGSVVTGGHTHSLPRLFPWIRQLEFSICLTDAFNMPLRNKHFFTAGLFPFELGRGISLGSAYAVDPDVLGYYSEKAVDQFAPGFLFNGDLLSNERLSYDVYVGILNNRSDSFDNVNMFIRGHECGTILNQARGFGIFNYLIASRLKWKAYDKNNKTLTFEPYALYNNDREQKVSFVGDAESKLGIFGLGMEYIGDRFEAGFEVARNVGHQKVCCVDNDVIQLENRNGQLYFVHSDIIAIATQGDDTAGKKAVDNSENQNIANQSSEDSSQNGQQIGTSNLQNSATRFRNGFTNKFNGNMFIADALYWIKPGKCNIAWAVGYASGDEAPNKQIKADDPADQDGVYEGFVGLQEKYSGTRVKSAFLLSGSSKIPRILTVPEMTVPGEQFPLKVSRFTNLIFVGSGFTIKVKNCDRPWNINSNILSYWTDITVGFNDPKDSNKRKCADRYLGTELNVFAENYLLPDLKLYVVFGVFVPGQFYRDIKGIPLNKEQQKYLDSLNDTNNQAPKVPVLSAHNAYFFNAGFEYRF